MNTVYRQFILIIFIITACAATQSGDTPCENFETLTIRQCGNRPLDSIDTSKVECLIARYLKRYTTYVRDKAIPCSASIALMEKRYNTFSDRKTYRIDNTMVQWLGDSTAPVSLILYISMSCPHCKQVYKQIYDTLHANRSLQKKVRVGIKYRSETRFDKVLRATTAFGKQPAFLRRCADHTGRIDDKAVKKIASMIAIPYDSLIGLAYTPEVTVDVKASKKEAIDNGVKFTPAIFLNRRKYYSTKNAEWILDAADYFANEKKSAK